VKIYRELTLDMESGAILHEDSYEYDGPVAKAAGGITVARSIDQAYAETVQKRQFFGENDVLLNPSLTPILTLVTKIGNRKKSTNSARVEWIEDDYLNVWGQVSLAANLTSVATGILVADPTLFAVNDLVAVPVAASSSAVEEVIQVTAINGNTLTVTRGIGGSGNNTIGATADLRILAPAFPEGAAYGTVRTVAKSVLISYTQIFRRPVSVTKSEVAQALFGPSNDRLYQRKKMLEEHRRDMESAGLWSHPSEALALPGTLRTTMGLKNRIVTNVYNANTTLTEGAFLTFTQTAFGQYYEGNEKLLVAAPVVISALDWWADNKLRLAPGDDVYGVKLSRYTTNHGDFMVTRDLNLQNAPTGSGVGWGAEAYALDIDSIEFAPLVGNGENRDTQLLIDVIKDGADQYRDEYLTEAAWVIRFEKRHGRVYGVTTYS
jgi:hypothetical protein